jgi:NDP-sugar pyrophosphorylase family protein
MTDISLRPSMRGGIIAAGHGTRLRADGYRVSKPMVPVAGRPLIDLTLDRFRAGVRRLTIIINEASDDCRRWLRPRRRLDLDLINCARHRRPASFRLSFAD